jgi:hypothetical protein
MKKQIFYLVYLLGFILPTLPSLAFTVTDGSAHVQILSGPQAFTNNGPLQSDTDIFFFKERSDYVLPSNLTVDVTQPGTYVTNNLPSSTSEISSGTQIDSYLIHMDVLNTKTFTNAATILFSNTILGLILIDPQLTDSDWVGDPNSLYSPPPKARWVMEPHDQITLENDRRTLVIDSLRVGKQGFGDQIRIITSPETIVPEPAVAGLVVFAGFSFIGINRFLRRTTGK